MTLPALPIKLSGWPHIRYEDAILKYGTDKPDLRNPLEIVDVTSVFARDDVEFKAFKGIIEKGGVVRAIKAPSVGDQPRSFFDKLNSWAQSEGAFGLGYILYADGEGKGPIAKFVPDAAQEEMRQIAGMADGDAIFFICDKESKAATFAGKARTKIAQDMDIIEKGVFKLCWIIDFPMYEIDEATGKLDFSHNPFSMPQDGAAAFDKDPLDIYAYQYDAVCNGFELCSGAIRNHQPEIMEKAFGLAGYDKAVLEEKFGGMLNAMRYGAPPHGGCAFGIDRIVMLFANEQNLREVNAFTYNGQGEDLLMSAPNDVSPEQLKDLHIKLSLPKQKLEKSEAA